MLDGIWTLAFTIEEKAGCQHAQAVCMPIGNRTCVLYCIRMANDRAEQMRLQRSNTRLRQQMPP